MDRQRLENVKSRISLAVSLFAVTAFLAACATETSTDNDGGERSTTVTGEVKEWTVSVDNATVPAGDLTFTVTNAGTMDHEFLVVKTDLPDGAIPLEGDRFSESLESISVIDEIGEFAAGTTETLTVTLEPGNYQLVCNIPAHYQLGMHTPFVVE